MKFLLDTNVVIPAEDVCQGQDPSSDALGLQRRAAVAGATLFTHPAQRADVTRDKNRVRRAYMLFGLKRYPELRPLPAPDPRLSAVFGDPQPGTNDFVDCSLLAALTSDAVDFLITEDKRIHARAGRVGLADRVLFLANANAMLDQLAGVTPAAPPAVRGLLAYELDESDPIFASLRDDYAGFDQWLRKCRLQHRQCWVVSEGPAYAAVVLVNEENYDRPHGTHGRVLKICTFKVAQEAHGRQYGELLLKTVFDYARANSFETVFITAFPKQIMLLPFLQEFGFVPGEFPNERGEIVLVKRMGPPSDAPERGLVYNTLYGPYSVDWSQQALLVPIRPEYHKLLFPDQQDQPPLSETVANCGHALRKAYLSKSEIAPPNPGSVIWFYRSRDLHAITTCCVVEKSRRFDEPERAAAFVADRGVYSLDQISAMAKGPLLAIRFRQAHRIKPVIRLQDMLASGGFAAAPQAIMRISEEGSEWLIDAAKLRS